MVVRCHGCNAMLLFFEQVHGTMRNMRSFGTELHVDHERDNVAVAHCERCGRLTEFDSRLLPSFRAA